MRKYDWKRLTTILHCFIYMGYKNISEYLYIYLYAYRIDCILKITIGHVSRVLGESNERED